MVHFMRVVDDECILVACICVCLTVCCRTLTVLHGPGCNLGGMVGCPLIAHYWADLQPVHRCLCYDKTAPNVKCQRVIVLALRLVNPVTPAPTVEVLTKIYITVLLINQQMLMQRKHHTTPQPFYGHFSGTAQVSWCQKRTSGLHGVRED